MCACVHVDVVVVDDVCLRVCLCVCVCVCVCDRRSGEVQVRFPKNDDVAALIDRMALYVSKVSYFVLHT